MFFRLLSGFTGFRAEISHIMDLRYHPYHSDIRCIRLSGTSARFVLLEVPVGRRKRDRVRRSGAIVPYPGGRGAEHVRCTARVLIECHRPVTAETVGSGVLYSGQVGAQEDKLPAGETFLFHRFFHLRCRVCQRLPHGIKEHRRTAPAKRPHGQSGHVSNLVKVANRIALFFLIPAPPLFDDIRRLNRPLRSRNGRAVPSSIHSLIVNSRRIDRDHFRYQCSTEGSPVQRRFH